MSADDVVLQKTPKGQEEITHRSYRLPQRLRTALILVDGRSTWKTLRAAWSQLGDETRMLEQFIAEGFVEPVAIPHAETLVRAGPSIEDMQHARKRALAILHEQLGPYADPLCLRLERVKDSVSFREEVERIAEILRASQSAASAENFRVEVLTVLGVEISA